MKQAPDRQAGRLWVSVDGLENRRRLRVIGGMLVVSGDMTHPATILGAIAILVATINIAGGFLVTQRMLKMFRK